MFIWLPRAGRWFSGVMGQNSLAEAAAELNPIEFAPYEAATRTNMPAIAMPSPGKAQAVTARAPGDFERTRIGMPALGRSALAADGLAAQADGPADEAIPEYVSHTRWFIAALDPDTVAALEGEALDFHTMDHMSDRYTAQEPLPDSVRRAYSLEAE
jgi:hypothetical protein